MSETSPTLPTVSFKFLNFFVKESNIILNQQGDPKIQVNFYPKGYIFKSLHQFHLEVALEIKEETNKFSIRIVAVAVFEFDENADLENYKTGFFVLNAPAIMFPYIRAYISSLTALSGLFTVTLPTFNLTTMGEALKNNIQEME